MSLLYRYKPKKDQWLRPSMMWLNSLGIGPNMVTVAGLFLSLIGAMAAAEGYIFPGLLFFTAGACLDCIDGSLARTSGKCTEFGRYLDGTSDRISEGLFLVGAVIGGAPVVALVIAIGSTVQLLLRTAWHRNDRNSNSFWFSRPERFAVIVAGLLLPGLYGSIVLWSGALLCTINLLLFALPSIAQRSNEGTGTMFVPLMKGNIFRTSITTLIAGEEVEKDDR